MKKRIDLYLVEKGYFESREQASRSIMAGEIKINNKIIDKPSQLVGEDLNLVISPTSEVYVSRGAYKLAKAIKEFDVGIDGQVCLDAGASTGGFTDYLLQNGAKQVYAIDVGYGQLAWKLRQDHRVTVFERQNIRYFSRDNLTEMPSLITADLSFISLSLVFTKFAELTDEVGKLITLIKPQFEAGKDKVGKKGVVKDRRIHEEVLQNLQNKAISFGWHLQKLTFSPLLGPEGNIEYLGLWQKSQSTAVLEVVKVVEQAWLELKTTK